MVRHGLEQDKVRIEVYHRVDELDAIVLGGVVTGGDHDTNGLAIELARAQRGQESNTVDNRVEDVARDGECIYRTTGGRGTYAFIRNWYCRQHCVYSIKIM
jgi:hypothetical protein